MLAEQKETGTIQCPVPLLITMAWTRSLFAK